MSPYRVLDLTEGRALLAGQMLARLGAEVIQVEPPGGRAGDRSFVRAAYAAGKRSVTCDLDRTEGRALFLRLLETADVLIESAEPDAMARRGLDYATLREAFPRLVHVSITPFGSTGPKAGYAATDLTIWAAGGPLLPARRDERAPLRISVPQSLLHAAADAANGALVALFARRVTGRGQHVDVSAQQSVAQATLSSVLAAAVGHENFSIRPQAKNTQANGTGRKLLDLSGSGARTGRTKWVVADGVVELHLAMGPATGRFTNNLFAWMHEEGGCDDRLAAWDWVTLPGRIEANEIGDDEVEHARTLVAAFLAPRTKAELIGNAMRRKLLLAPVLTIADLVDSPQLAARGYFQAVEDAAGRRSLLPGAFAAVDSPAFVPTGAAPEPGQDNAPVYGRIGLAESDIAALQAQGVI
ncbi:CaiB/BaiF CoA transferase family protein [Azospirillum sp.]|uniref:CaiB/BaiF CoA transferase family protein n=1 Tax=Azospirillum sp. TaxID=34012 RepID=UPI002D247253|nr:CoA transferase [Azospirillum sp.]HYD69149.1 CoA transferase [Azospirillum sp.]